jgi:hypothetical protein
MAIAGANHERLHGFLLGSFNRPEFEQFLKFNGYEDVIPAVAQDLPLDAYFLGIVEALNRRGRLDARFFSLLQNERPARGVEIEGLSRTWFGKSATGLERPGGNDQVDHAVGYAAGSAAPQHQASVILTRAGYLLVNILNNIKEGIKIISISILLCCMYGIINDLVTANLCIEFYTLFPIKVRSDNPIVVAVVFGVLTTWWVGLILGIVAAFAARLGDRPKLDARDLVGPIIVVVLCAGAAALLFGLVAHALISPALGRDEEIRQMLTGIPPEKFRIALSINAAHTGAYLAGFAGGLAVCLWAILERSSPQRNLARKPDGVSSL